MKRFLITILTPWKSPIPVLLIGFLWFLNVLPDITGDLGRIGQIVFSKDYHSQDKFEENIDKQTYWCDSDEIKDYQVLFMGDSFTKSFYPYYVSKRIEGNTAKFFASNIEAPEQAFVTLCNNNVKMPQVVVLESVERVFVERLSNLNFDYSIQLNGLMNRQAMEQQTDFTTYYKNQLINNHSVLHLSLMDSLFTCPGKEKELYFYHDDIKIHTEKQIQIAVLKLDTLFQLAKDKHICLFYVIAADKYDVYQEFAIDNPYPRKTVLDGFYQFESNPCFVNTRQLLNMKAKEGITDLYYADDTHWSPIGAKIVADEIARRMDSLGILQN